MHRFNAMLQQRKYSIVKLQFQPFLLNLHYFFAFSQFGDCIFVNYDKKELHLCFLRVVLENWKKLLTFTYRYGVHCVL